MLKSFVLLFLPLQWNHHYQIIFGSERDCSEPVQQKPRRTNFADAFVEAALHASAKEFIENGAFWDDIRSTGVSYC